MPVETPVRRAYRATFDKHRWLFCIAPVLGALLAATVMLAKGSNYQASASLWIDNPPPLGSSLNSTNASQASAAPSTQVQSLLTELLNTRAFVFNVADGSQLRSYLGAHSKTDLDDAIMASVGPNTTSTAPGPQVLVIDYKGPNAAVAQSVLQRLIVELQSSASRYGDVYVASTLNYYKSQANSASTSVKSTQNEIARYLREHPGASSTADPAYSALIAASQAASTQLSQAETNRVQASGALRVGANSPIVKVVDKPTLPTATSTGKKKLLESVMAGFVAGAFISLLAIVLMTPGTPEPFERVPFDHDAILRDDADEFGEIVDDPRIPLAHHPSRSMPSPAQSR